MNKRRASVLFFLSGPPSKASARVRGYWLADALREQGASCLTLHGDRRSTYLGALRDVLRHDVIYFQKRYCRWDLLLMRLANRLGKTTVLDLDDAPSKHAHPITLRNVEHMMRGVSLVTVGSQNLLHYAELYQPNSHLLPSSIKLENYPVREKRLEPDEPVCLGWIGNGRHYAQDLIQILAQPLQELAAMQPLHLRIVGAGGVPELYDTFGSIPGLETAFVDEIDWADPESVIRELHQFDIGLYPLLDTPSNRMKCAFKALEYMAVGIPVVASPVGANATVVEDGFHASNRNQWLNSLITLAESVELQKNMGKKGREKVETEYDINKTSLRFWNLVSS